jgi:hypothetical protein
MSNRLNHFVLSGRDFLFTDDYNRHHKFYFSVTVAASLILFFTLMLVLAEPVILHFGGMLTYFLVIRGLFYLFNYVNNIYQICAHVLTGAKFMNLGIMAAVDHPYGAKPEQHLSSHTISNVFDIVGWITIMMARESVGLIPCLMAATHMSTGIVSVGYGSVYSQNPKTGKYTADTFNYEFWIGLRSSFVSFDALCRGFLLFI